MHLLVYHLYFLLVVRKKPKSIYQTVIYFTLGIRFFTVTHWIRTFKTEDKSIMSHVLTLNIQS